MAFAWPAWIVAICSVASLACIVAGAVMAALASARVFKHLERTSDAAKQLDPQRMETALARINSAAENVAPLIDRLRAAVSTLNRSLQQLRLPEAMLALRAARAAVRLLFSGR